MLMIQINQIRIKYLGEFIVICKNLQVVEQEKCLMKKNQSPPPRNHKASTCLFIQAAANAIWLI
jgi:hypothetical protein